MSCGGGCRDHRARPLKRARPPSPQLDHHRPHKRAAANPMLAMVPRVPMIMSGKKRSRSERDHN
jgi:hypothetical protein